MKYHIWTEGCQMNVADSQRIASELEEMGCRGVLKINQCEEIENEIQCHHYA